MLAADGPGFHPCPISSPSPCLRARPEALVARSLLESEGLFAFVPDLNIHGADFDPAFSSGGYRVLVREEDAATARGFCAMRRWDWSSAALSTHAPRFPDARSAFRIRCQKRLRLSAPDFA